MVGVKIDVVLAHLDESSPLFELLPAHFFRQLHAHVTQVLIPQLLRFPEGLLLSNVGLQAHGLLLYGPSLRNVRDSERRVAKLLQHQRLEVFPHQRVQFPESSSINDIKFQTEVFCLKNAVPRLKTFFWLMYYDLVRST